MKYDLIEIHQTQKGWKYINQRRDNISCVTSKTYPHPNGFFYYPRTTKPEKAFALLKAVVIKKHQEEIDRLQKSLDKLKQLKYQSCQPKTKQT